MGEKRGMTGKLQYDFPTEAVLEVMLNGTFYRITAKEFRSFDGVRRISKPIKQPGIGDDVTKVEIESYLYEGPVYEYGNNTKVPFTGSNRIVSSSVLEANQKTSKKRGK
jgi:hypothetical protein